MRGAECWTDHGLVSTVLKLHITSLQRKLPKTVRAMFNTERLKHGFYCQRFQEMLDEDLQTRSPLTKDSTEMWEQFKTTVTKTAKTILAPKQRVRQDWFIEDDE